MTTNVFKRSFFQSFYRRIPDTLLKAVTKVKAHVPWRADEAVTLNVPTGA